MRAPSAAASFLVITAIAGALLLLFVGREWSPGATAPGGPTAPPPPEAAAPAGELDAEQATPASAAAPDPASGGAKRAAVDTPLAAAAPAPAKAEAAAARDPVLAVRTERGEPVAGVPVALRVTNASGARLAWRGESQAPAGTVRIEGFAEKAAGSGPPLPAALLAFPHAGGDAAAVAIDPADVPVEPVVLVLPPTGRVEVLLEGEGAATASGVTVTLGCAGTGAGTGADAGAGTGADAPYAPALAEHGRARFPFVGLGLELEVVVARAGQSQVTRVLAAGPRTRGETVVVRAPLAEPDWCIVVLHLQDDAGAPFRDTRLDMNLQSKAEGSNSSSSTSITTDGEGTLRWVVDDALGDAAQRTLSLRTAAGDVQLARIELPRLRRGENDLGVVTLRRPALVCGGTVIDSEGRPIAGAPVRVQGKKGSGRDTWWSNEHGLETATDAEGAFAVRGVPQARELGVSASAKGFLPLEPQPFVLGAAGLRLVLQKASGLAGSVRLGDVLDPGDVVVEVRRDSQNAHNAPQEPLTERPARNAELGDFAFASLEPGVVAVHVRAVGELRGGLLVDGVALRAGETTRDPRLQEVDLLAGLRRVSFTVVDASGARVPDAEALVLDGDPAQSEFEGILLPQGQGRLFTRAASLDLFVHAEGHRWTRADGVVDGQQIMLPSATVVRLRLAPAVASGLAGAKLRASLHRLDAPGPSEGRTTAYHGTTGTRSSSGTLAWAGWIFGEVGTGGEAVLSVESPGRYECTWSLGRGGKAVHSTLSEVRVGELDTELVLDAGITAEDLAAARGRD